MEDTTDADYAHAKKFVKILKQKTLMNIMICMLHYCVTSVTLLLVDALLVGLDPAHFLSALGLAWQAALKKTNVK